MEPSTEGTYTGGVRPLPLERGHQVHGGKQEVLLMGRAGEDAAPAECPLPGQWAFSTKAEQLTSHLQNTQRIRGTRSATRGKRRGRSRPRTGALIGDGQPV